MWSTSISSSKYEYQIKRKSYENWWKDQHKKKCSDLLKNSLNLLFKEMYKQVLKSVWRINIFGD